MATNAVSAGFQSSCPSQNPVDTFLHTTIAALKLQNLRLGSVQLVLYVCCPLFGIFYPPLLLGHLSTYGLRLTSRSAQLTTRGVQLSPRNASVRQQTTDLVASAVPLIGHLGIRGI